MPQPDNANSPAQPTNKPTNEPPGKPAATPANPPRKPAKRAFQAPKGTRDWYPADANLRRYITEAWRNASIRHGFEEIDGPTLEDADLYKVKSGDGILAEMFGVFSGKSPEDVAQVRETGEAPLVLRPEFTPTLARMVAARAAQLPKPTKWFTAGPFFRAERPQRGRLREFLQWNVDFIGLPAVSEVAQVSNLGSGAARASNPQPSDPLAEARARADAECIACCIELLRSLGLPEQAVVLRFSDRRLIEVGLRLIESESNVDAVLALLDKRAKIGEGAIEREAKLIGLDWPALCRFLGNLQSDLLQLNRDAADSRLPELDGLYFLWKELKDLGLQRWCTPDTSIVRGLAYYTGMVFEVIADGERAVAGGGRYDNLIELFGGPPTPAVGFGMGDVVLTNLLRDKGLLPEGAALLDHLSAPPASSRPDAFVFTADDALDPIVRRLVADLRRGTTGGMAVARHSHGETPDEGTPEHACAEPQACHPLHARHPYKATRNIGKLLKEAAAQHARVAVIIENDTTATIKPLDGGEQTQCTLADAPATIARLVTR